MRTGHAERTTHRGAAARRPAGLARGGAKDGYGVSGRIWIEKGGATYLAWGRVVLLERIRDHGSWWPR